MLEVIRILLVGPLLGVVQVPLLADLAVRAAMELTPMALILIPKIRPLAQHYLTCALFFVANRPPPLPTCPKISHLHLLEEISHHHPKDKPDENSNIRCQWLLETYRC